MKGLAGLPDKSYDLALVDPPYGLPAESTHGRGKLKDRIINRDNIQSWDIAPDKAYFDELFRVSRYQIIWGGNYFDLPPTRCIVVWDKMQPWENFSQVEIAWTNFDYPSPLFRYDNRRGGKIHPTQKPVELYVWLLRRFAKKGWKILDTHVGSGSSRIACHELVYDFLGYEISDRYWELQEKRFREHKRQLVLI
jgi:site-specific DNA-methyltransferase (adenine-specific)